MKNKERFPQDQCQSCGTLLHEDDGKVCDTCRKEMREQGIYLKDWLEEQDTSRNPDEVCDTCRIEGVDE
jgi:uncharacterized Zn finger protein (UPF0148 family)